MQKYVLLVLMIYSDHWCIFIDCVLCSLLQSDGLRILEELLCSRGSLIEDRIEAAGVLAQITSPWISDNHKINQLDNYVYNMVNALTGKSFDIAFRKGLKRRLGKELEHHQKSLNDKKNRWFLHMVFENHRKSQHCERSELRFNFDWTKVH